MLIIFNSCVCMSIKVIFCFFGISISFLLHHFHLFINAVHCCYELLYVREQRMALFDIPKHLFLL